MLHATPKLAIMLHRVWHIISAFLLNTITRTQFTHSLQAVIIMFCIVRKKKHSSAAFSTTWSLLLNLVLVLCDLYSFPAYVCVRACVLFIIFLSYLSCLFFDNASNAFSWYSNAQTFSFHYFTFSLFSSLLFHNVFPSESALASVALIVTVLLQIWSTFYCFIELAAAPLVVPMYVYFTHTHTNTNT